ncbi:ornithine carbamoyltransferase [Nocardioides sp. Soil774]|uniref:ornithine carbamoyltransferase n=1 Tax=Nocardioides sp. Soil774 TaxID=1736408 RepID=UPI0006F3D5EF|nr:ornithine carbamoyltransferase [Nocardioides sp. Soil774]KRE92683.1 ornithine carbamoyltransferase [Nocardioides sp. Soil774]
MTRHFLRDDDLSPAELLEVLDLADAMKADPFGHKPLTGPHTVALVFDRPTLRTQVSFAAGIAELGGNPMTVDGGLAAMGSREGVEDVARVLGRQAAAIVWRTAHQSDVVTMAEHAGVPVLNALTDEFHPCQLLADLQTVREHKGRLAGVRAAFVGDGACNMGNSWFLAGAAAGMHVVVGAPEGFHPDPDVVAKAREVAQGTGGSVELTTDPVEAVTGADVVVTDSWVSMGREEEAGDRMRVFPPYGVTEELLAHAAADAIVMHCLPAYRGKEIAEAVIEGPQSVVWDEAENRRHAQKAVLTWLLEKSS